MPALRPPLPAGASATPLGYQPALDGLRAVAAGAVLLYHGGVGWASAGFLGVDVFFVLSGFLITWLLVDEHAREGRISVKAFYGRRFRRLLPALVLVVAFVAVYAVTLAPSGQLAQLRADLLATAGYVSNWRFVASGQDYFDQFTAPSPLAHTWSLSVEEQWYLLWPLTIAGVLGLATRWRRPGLPATAVTLLVVASVAWTVALDRGGADASRLHFGTDVRAQELLGGAVLAMVLHRRRGAILPARWQRPVDVVGVAALAWLLWAMASLDDSTGWLHSTGLLAMTIVTGLVVLAAVQPGSVLRRTLSWRPLVAAGLVSYGLYLWHYPVYVALSAGRTGLHGTTLLGLRLLVTVALSVASYRLVERPVRDRRWSPVPVLTTGGLALAASVTAVALLAGPLAPGRGTTASAAAPIRSPGSTDGPAADGRPIPALTDSELAAYDEHEQVARDRIEAVHPDPFAYEPEDNPPPIPALDDDRVRLFMTGDSVSLTLVQGFPIEAEDDVLFWNRSEIGCGLFPGERRVRGRMTEGGHCDDWRADRPNWLDQFDADLVMISSTVWETYDVRVDGTWLEFGSPAFDDYFSDHLDDLIELLSSDGAPVVVLTAPCSRPPDTLTGEALPEADDQRVEHLNELYRAAVERHPGTAALVDFHEFVCPGGEFVGEVGGQVQRDDGTHFTVPGAVRAWRWLLPQLLAVLHDGVALSDPATGISE